MVKEEDKENAPAGDEGSEEGSKKKKLSKKQLEKLQAKMEEQARIQAHLEKERLFEEVKERVQKEWDFNVMKHKIFILEHEKRMLQLKTSFRRIDAINKKWWEYLLRKRKNNEWNQYMKCNRLPDPNSIREINTFIFVWAELEANESMSYTVQKAKEAMELLDGVEKAIIDPGWTTPGCLAEWKKVRREVRCLLQKQVDRTTYRILRGIETQMETINVTTTKFSAHCPFFTLCLWAELIMPIPSSKATETKIPLTVSFEEVKLTVVIPKSLSDVQKALRALWLNYDHWTDECRTFDCPPFPFYYRQDLLQLTLDEFAMKVSIVNYRNNEEEEVKERIGQIPPEHTISQELLAWMCQPQRVLSEEVAFQEGEEEMAWRKESRMKTDPFELNLREFSFLGGILFFDILYQPPQPKYLRYKHNVTLLTDVAELHPVEFDVQYPSLEETSDLGKAPEEENKFKSSTINLNDEIQKLVTVKLRIPDNVLWFEAPKAAVWNRRLGWWSIANVHDFRFNEHEQVLTFRTGRLGLMGLFVHRYCNFPYQYWELAPASNGSVTFRLVAAKVSLQFEIREHQVCLTDISNAPSAAMNWLLGKYYTPLELMQLMRKGGIDVFPPPDATCYVTGATQKHVVGENHVYQIWGIFSTTFQFKFSKFNRQVGRRDMIFQTKEDNEQYETSFCLIRTSPADATILDITEDSEDYSFEPAPGLQFCADLYNLIYNNCTNTARRKSEGTNFRLIQTVRDLMAIIRPLSYS